MTPKPTMAAESAGPRVTFVTLDNHLASAVDRARRTLAKDIPGLSLTFHAACDWNDPKALEACRTAISRADIIVATMLFMEEHAEAVKPAIQARRAHCEAVIGCMSAPDIVKLTRIGRFNMDGSKRGAFDFLKKLRGKSSSETGGAAQLAMLKRIPRILQIHPRPRAGRARLFPHAAILARRLRRECCAVGAFPRRPLRRRRVPAFARRLQGRGADRLSRRRRLPPASARPRLRERRQAAGPEGRARDRRHAVDALLHPGRQHRALRRGD